MNQEKCIQNAVPDRICSAAVCSRPDLWSRGPRSSEELPLRHRKRVAIFSSSPELQNGISS
jgi:hypothetical protein